MTNGAPLVPEPHRLDLATDQKELFKKGDDDAVGGGGVSLLWHLARAGEVVPPWWSPSRDRELRRFWKSSDHLGSALYNMVSKITTIPVRVEARDRSVPDHVEQAQEFTELILTKSYSRSDPAGLGWTSMLSPALEDHYGQDNGMFILIEGPGRPDGPLTGKVKEIVHLDAARCQRTSSRKFPVIYTMHTGRQHKIHYTRIIAQASLPSAALEMHGVGNCAHSRAINTAQHLVDIGVFKQEKLGSRPVRQIVFGRDISAEALQSAFATAEEAMDSAGLRRYAKQVYIGILNRPNASIDTIPLSAVPDGFDERTSITLGMYVIAMAYGVDARELWPATASGATKADATIQHMKARGKGPGQILQMFTRQFNAKVLPPHLKLVFDFQDDEQDRSQAEIRGTRAKTRTTNLTAGVTTPRIEREKMVTDGDLSEAQFEALELEDGRLPEGTDVLSLFGSVEPFFIKYLDLGVEEPLALETNDPYRMMTEIETAALNVQDVLASAESGPQRQNARQVLAALGKLKNLYVPIVTQQMQMELAAQGAEEDEGVEPEEAEKGFGFGVGVGEVIRGQLARGAVGRFVNIEKLKAQLAQGILERRAAYQAGGREGAAASKRGQNRDKVTEKLGLPEGTVDGLAGLRAGEEMDESTFNALAGQGLAERLPDGTMSMTASGRSLLGAANSGDVDKAKKALAKAKEPKKVKKSPEQRKRDREAERQRKAAEREQERQRELAENQDKVKGVMPAQVGDAGFNALAEFRDGAALSSEMATRLAQTGLVELDAAGNPRLTSSGRSVLGAADRGDVRAARDAISRANEKVSRTLEKAAKLRERATEASDKAEERAIALREQAEESETKAKAKAEKKLGQADKYSEQAEESVAKASELTSEADDLDGEATASTDEAAAELDEQKKEKLLKKAERFRKQAKRKREQAGRQEKRAKELQEKSDRVEAEAEEVLSSGRERAEELRGRVTEVKVDADRISGEFITRAGELSASVGGAPVAEQPATPGVKQRALHLVDRVKGFFLNIKQSSSERVYGREVRSAARGLWSGALDWSGFLGSMDSTVRRGFRRAWLEGAAECGVSEGDLTDQEKTELRIRIMREVGYISGFADYVEARSRAEGYLLRALTPRITLWVNRYRDARNQAMQMACRDKKLRWIYGDTEHCDDCLMLNNRVYRASIWEKYGLRPQSPDLQCKGFRCECVLELTDDPVTSGRPPSLRG